MSTFTRGFQKRRLAGLVAGPCSLGGHFFLVACSCLQHPSQSELRTTQHRGRHVHHGAGRSMQVSSLLHCPRHCCCCLCLTNDHLHANPLLMVLVRFFGKLQRLLLWDAFQEGSRGRYVRNVQNPPERTLLTDRGAKLQSRFPSSIQQVKCSGGWTSPPALPLRGALCTRRSRG